MGATLPAIESWVVVSEYVAGKLLNFTFNESILFNHLSVEYPLENIA
jgi:hypothetical protein